MPIRQDLCLALVLAVLGGANRAEAADGELAEALATLERAIAWSRLSEAEARAVRALVRQAQAMRACGDEDAAACAMVEVIETLRAA